MWQQQTADKEEKRTGRHGWNKQTAGQHNARTASEKRTSFKWKLMRQDMEGGSELHEEKTQRKLKHKNNTSITSMGFYWERQNKLFCCLIVATSNKKCSETLFHPVAWSLKWFLPSHGSSWTSSTTCPGDGSLTQTSHRWRGWRWGTTPTEGPAPSEAAGGKVQR